MITVALVAMIAASYSMDTDASVSSGPNCEEFGTTPYEVLGITPSANRKKIKKAFRSHMRRLHPEKIGVDPKHVKCLYHAFETIMNPPETHEATTDPFKTSKGFNFKVKTAANSATRQYSVPSVNCFIPGVDYLPVERCFSHKYFIVLNGLHRLWQYPTRNPRHFFKRYSERSEESIF